MTRLVVALVGVLAIACHDDVSLLDPSPVPAHADASSTIALASSGDRLWLTSPDDDRLVAVGTDDLEVQRFFNLAGQPEQLLLLGDRIAAVSLSRASQIALVNLDDGHITQVDVPCGGTAGMTGWLPGEIALSDPPDGRLWVACPHDDQLVEVDLARETAVRVIEMSGRPSALAVSDGALVVALAGVGEVAWLDLTSIYRAPEQTWPSLRSEDFVVQTVAPEPLPGVAASQIDVLVASPSVGPIAAYQRVEHDADRSRPPEQGGYGSVIDGDPRIEPMLLAPCGERYARFDGGVRAMSGPRAIAYDAVGENLWVVHQYTDNVAVLHCPAAGGEARDTELVELRASFRTGRGPRGIAVTPDGRTAFVDVGFDHAVARLRLDAPSADGGQPEPREWLRPELERRRELGAAHLSEAAQRGRSIFYDAVDTHLTPSGVVTCATCHPSGGDDGLSWFLHTSDIAPKLRRTPAAWNAGRANAPFHWDGEFERVSDLTAATVHALLEGDGLLVDFEAVSAYLDELEPPPGRPSWADDDLAARVAEGEALFSSANVGCAGCHIGESMTVGESMTDGAPHGVLAPSTDTAADLPAAITPSLRAVRARPPFLHDGRAATLESVLTEHNPDDRHGVTSHLDAAQIDALVAYLRTL